MLTEHSISIDAPPDLVWNVTRHVEGWPQWTPTVTSVVVIGDPPFGAGSVAEVKQPGQPVSTWVVTRWDEGRGFSWRSDRPGLRMVATHRIEPEGAGSRNTLLLEAKGALATVLRPLLSLAVGRALRAENRGLKRRCEELAAAAVAGPGG
jgi:hypothetical protein